MGVILIPAIYYNRVLVLITTSTIKALLDAIRALVVLKALLDVNKALLAYHSRRKTRILTSSPVPLSNVESMQVSQARPSVYRASGSA